MKEKTHLRGLISTLNRANAFISKLQYFVNFWNLNKVYFAILFQSHGIYVCIAGVCTRYPQHEISILQKLLWESRILHHLTNTLHPHLRTVTFWSLLVLLILEVALWQTNVLTIIPFQFLLKVLNHLQPPTHTILDWPEIVCDLHQAIT